MIIKAAGTGGRVLDSGISYESLVSRLVMENIEAANVSFPVLLRSLPGIWPETVVQHLENLRSNRAGLKPQVQALLDDARSDFRLRSHISNPFAAAMPVEHPLDFEWRFTEEAIGTLWGEYDVASRTAHSTASVRERDFNCCHTDPEVVLLGSPSLLWSAFQKGIAHNCLLLDSNENIVHWFVQNGIPHAIHCNVDSTQPLTRDARFLVLDPPWYQSHHLTFLWHARNMCALGGKVAVSIPPLGTRPGILSERRELFGAVQKMGYEIEKLHPDCLPYRAPFFEVNALTALGLCGVPREWRRGDLMVLRAERGNDMPSPAPLTWKPWAEVQVSCVRWRVNLEHTPPPNTKSGPDLALPRSKLTSLIPGDILPAVSTRDPNRVSANVWTSGNRIFHSDDAKAVLRALFEVRAEETRLRRSGSRVALKELADHFPLSQLARQIIEITINENREMQAAGYF